MARGSNFVVNLKPEAESRPVDSGRIKKNIGFNFRPPSPSRFFLLKQRVKNYWAAFRGAINSIKLNGFSFRRTKQKPLFRQPRFNLLRREDRLWSEKSKSLTWRYFFYFSLILLLLSIPFKILSYYHLIQPNGLRFDLISISEQAISQMFSASQKAGSGDLTAASQSLAQAAEDFRAISEQLDRLDELALLLGSWSGSPELKMASEGKKIATAGWQAAELGKSLSQALQAFNINQLGQSQSLSQAIDQFIVNAQEAVKLSHDLKDNLSSLDQKNFPNEYLEPLAKLQTQVEGLDLALGEMLDLAKQSKNFLGVSQDRRYLLVFQNNNELRASGGFIGSYALLDIKSGQIKNITIPAGGSYETAGGLRALVRTPEPLRLVSPLWYFWDANWWPDWEMSAKNLMWFYEKSDGPTVDGVISLTPTVIEDLLKVFGPVDLQSEYGVTIDADNFWLTTQAIVEKSGQPELYSSSSSWGKKLPEAVKNQTATSTPVNEPKRIIGDLFNKLLADIPQKLNPETMPALLKVLHQDLSNKQILFYFSDPGLQKQISRNSWGGQIKSAPHDYLMVVDTNIGGGKTDRVIKETIDYRVKIDQSDRIKAQLTITREHSGVKGEPFTGLRNLDWLRVYVPAGAKLISASGFESPDASAFETLETQAEVNEVIQKTEMKAKVDPGSNTQIYSESGKTVFANWSIVDPGETAVIVLEYELPFSLRPVPPQGFWNRLRSLWRSEPSYYYSLMLQSQPGALNRHFSWGLSNESKPQIVWQYPQTLGIMEGQVYKLEPLVSDHYYYLLFKE